MFFIACLYHFLTASVFLSWGLPSHSSRSLFSDFFVAVSLALGIWTID